MKQDRQTLDRLVVGQPEDLLVFRVARQIFPELADQIRILRPQLPQPVQSIFIPSKFSSLGTS